jgi:hypothetical protein
MLTTGVVGDLPARDPERLGCAAQTQAMLPTPADELYGIGSSVPLKRPLEQPVSTHVDLSRPHDTVPPLTDAGACERRRIAQRAQALEPKYRLAKINRKRLVVRPPQAQRVVARVPQVHDTDCISSLMCPPRNIASIAP